MLKFLAEDAVQGIMTPNQWTVIFTLLNLLLVYFIVKRFLYKPVKAMLDAREKEVSETYLAADQARENAESMQEEYRQRLAHAKQEASEIVSSASRKAALNSEQILTQAKEQASALLEKADRQIADEKKRAVNEMKNEISDIALLAAAKVLERDLTAEDHERLIEEFIENAEDITWQK
ncbi:MAG TPA: F0F1 ATP synthase subunit B [Firmicutes bacterium]|nr:F0F1 ATP synthase subunit B [Bacillota bacterium]